MYQLDGIASIFVKHYFPLTKSEFLPEKGTNQFSFYSFLVKQGFEIFNMEDAFCAGKTPKQLSKILPKVSDVILNRTRSAYTEMGQLVEYTMSYYDSGTTPYLIDYQV